MTESFDVLSDVLQSAPLRDWLAGPLDFVCPWRLLENGRLAAFVCVLEGHCRLELDADGGAVGLTAGDLLVMLPGREFRLGDGAASPAASLEEALRCAPTHARGGNGAAERRFSARLVCGVSQPGKHPVSALFASLPPFLVVKGEEGRAAPWLEETLRLMIRESRSDRPGRQALIDNLAQVILIQAIRQWAATLPAGNGHWLTALADAEIGPALQLMHAHLDWPWTVALLAERVCLSRSAFAARFKTLVSQPPLQYLLERRMQSACAMLAEGRYEIKEIAARIGYTTRTAFSNAFKRWCGESPGTYRLRARGGAAGSKFPSVHASAESAQGPLEAEADCVPCHSE
mgnify:CR=1 FL=1